MKRFALWLLVLFPAPLAAQPKDVPPAKPLVFTHVTVIDTTGGPVQPDRSVVITGDRITALGKSGEVDMPADAQVVDAAGKFLIPGLWDMHVHMAGKEFLTLFLANGVTGIRDMHAFYPQGIFQWRKEVATGQFPGPRIVAAGAIIDGPKPVWPGSKAAAGEKEGRKAVQELKNQGADFIKVYTQLPREAFFAIADEAKKQSLAFAGHVPESVSAAEASDAGQKSMEHLMGIVLACSTREEELRKEEMDAMGKADLAGLFTIIRRVQAKARDTYSEQKAAALFARFVKNGTWQVPTLTVLRMFGYSNDPAFTNDPRLKYMSPFVKNFWNPKTGPRSSLTDADYARLRANFPKDVKLVTDMHRAGVRFLAGTDATNPYCFPGFSLHDELERLVEAGFSPLEALQSATRNPAEFLGKLDSLGTVEKGKIADLVLLEANPLDNIGNTRKIEAVVSAGRYLPKAALQKMLAEVEAAANKK
jgi:imidazolonepropionase-like amidohydrolase